ncbi:MULTISPECIES: GPW/gp25 family protein [Pseudomonas]|uniref:GPW/gp25 family protein n=1 Tax=Pseudomonas TaxID=286 RepID=UPI000B351A7A|nr:MULTISPECIES: GPW/gp25 family protein [Pseudomonas]PMY64826.1 phage baseplate protein [Pseudomonas sp. FW305-25]PMY69254.1 phage baseplate protein [Pseudomonas sp. FW126-L8]PNA80057.1 phage baseplate protein [Pseudomonas sp. FW305-76]
MNNNLTQVYGRGWAFPPSFTMQDGVRMAEGQEAVHQSLHILFSTQPGERIMRSDYGCDLQTYMFSNIREELLAQVKTSIADALLHYEPRAAVDNVQVAQNRQSPSLLQVQVTYHLRGSDIVQKFKGQLDIADGQGVRML